MKVYISADIEGITGLVSWSHCGRGDSQHWDFPFARRMMTHDVNAAIRGAKAAGATEIVLKDSHGNSKNLLIDELEPGVRLVSGHGAGIDGMMEGIDETFDAAILVGYHAMAGTEAGVMEHTITGGVHRLRINGIPCGEIALSAGVAGRYGVPLVFISSDEAGCAEASERIHRIKTAPVKRGLGRYMAECLHPSETGSMIEAGVQNAISSRAEVRPWLPSEPTTITVEFNRSEEADMGAKLFFAQRIDAYTLEVKFDSYLLAHQACWNLVAMSFQGIAAQN
jgi:D-amino peptidase